MILLRSVQAARRSRRGPARELVRGRGVARLANWSMDARWFRSNACSGCAKIRECHHGDLQMIKQR